MENEIISNKDLGEELDKPINKKDWEKKSTLTPFVDNVWGADLADMKLIGKFNKGFRFLLCVIDTFSKYVWWFLLNIKIKLQLQMDFKNILDESNHKPNKIRVDKGSEFYNRSMQLKKRSRNVLIT